MIQPPDDRRAPLTPQLALRVTILGTFALAMFAIIFFRLWFLQVLSGDKYLAQANVNFARSIDIPAPRGEMLDASGNVLVKSIQSIAVQISPPQLPVPLQTCPSSEDSATGWQSSCSIAHPPQADAALYDRLARVLGMSSNRTKCHVDGYGYLRLSQIACSVAEGYVQVSYAKVTVKQDITNNDILFYLKERAQAFPGVSVEQVWLRQYPYKDLAAQLFGTIGPLSCNPPQHVKPNANNCELKDPRFKDLPASSIVGQSGLEWSYNKWLQGYDGSEKVQVNALGQYTGEISENPPTAGNNLKLSLSMPLQNVGQQALQESIDSNPPANGGAFVAMNPEDGVIYAMGSLPSFDPNTFAKPVPESEYEALNSTASNYPLINRAIQSVGPTGSTFKPITATAALESGAWSVDDTFDDTGQFCFSGQCRHNAGGAVDGDLDLVDAIRVSSDDFFYNLGVLTNNPAPKGGALQYWASQYGIGQKTGVDIGGEDAGTLPTPAWRAHVNLLEKECDDATGPFKGKPKHQPGGCGIADGTDRPWSVGDNENLAVGQGDVQVTPLQLAVVYSAIANNGTIVHPHVGLDVQNANGVVLQNIDPAPMRHLNIDPFYLDTIREGLREAASVPGGTSADVFGNFPEQVYGKTGTAQYNGQQDYAWYACFVPATATSKPIVVVVTVEQGGFGAVGAAPVAREILSQWFFGKAGQYTPGSSQTL